LRGFDTGFTINLLVRLNSGGCRRQAAKAELMKFAVLGACIAADQYMLFV
jgi:hypothetical protein